MELIEATDLESYRAAFGKVLTPQANAIFATLDDSDGQGHIGYSILGAIGKRAPNLFDGVDWGGRLPYDGSQSANDWQGALDVNERPHVIDPEEGWVMSANHLPVGSWFSDYAYTGIGSVGDTLRSLRLRYLFAELLPAADSKLSPADVHAMHFDAQHDVARIFRDMLTHLEMLGTLPSLAPSAPASSPEDKAAKLLQALEAWQQNGGELRHSIAQTPAAAGVVNLHGKFREAYHPNLVCKYNGAEGGLSFLLKSYDADPDAIIADPDVVAFVVTEGAGVWDSLVHLGSDPASWQAPASPPDFVVRYQDNQFCPATAGGNCSLDPALDFGVPLDAAFGNSILSSLGSTGTGTVDFSDVDASLHLAPMGVSEDPASPWFQSGLDAWLAADAGDPSSIPAAPLARELVEAKATSTETLVYVASP
jgi:hypothetical protein